MKMGFSARQPQNHRKFPYFYIFPTTPCPFPPAKELFLLILQASSRRLAKEWHEAFPHNQNRNCAVAELIMRHRHGNSESQVHHAGVFACLGGFLPNTARFRAQYVVIVAFVLCLGTLAVCLPNNSTTQHVVCRM